VPTAAECELRGPYSHRAGFLVGVGRQMRQGTKNIAEAMPVILATQEVEIWMMEI
jgi:hypothetical protein